MKTLEEQIRELIKEKFGSIPKFAKEIEEPQTSIYGALDRGMKNTRTELTDKIYRGLEIDLNSVSLTDFCGLRLISDSNATVEVPLLSRIAAGDPIEMEDYEDAFPIPARVHDRYPDAVLLRVDGESMNRILPNGCYALVDPCTDVEHDGMPYAVCVNGYDATIKRVRKLNNGFQLVPDSNDPTYSPTTYNFNEPQTDPVTVIGEVVYYVLPYDWGF